MKIAGILLTKNESEILADSVENKYINGVDDIYIIDHYSKDNTCEILKFLKYKFKKKIFFYKIKYKEFNQYAIQNAVIQNIHKNYDWIYIFDTDEFLLKNIKSVLKNHNESVSYNLENFFIKPKKNIRNAIYRPKKTFMGGLPYNFYTQLIKKNKLIYSQIDHNPKIILNTNDLAESSIGAGAHKLIPKKKLQKLPDKLVAHVPFNNENKLNNKISEMNALKKAGLKNQHGWQSYLVKELYSDQEKILFHFFVTEKNKKHFKLDKSLHNELSKIKKNYKHKVNVTYSSFPNEIYEYLCKLSIKRNYGIFYYCLGLFLKSNVLLNLFLKIIQTINKR